MSPPSTTLERLGVVVAGHVDHGKSTVVGHLLAASGVLPKGRLEQVQATCARLGRPFEYAFLLDALKDEQAQGITIDAARVFFRSARREYVVIDAPGHLEFLKNMVSGASRADAALLVVDAHAGVEDSTRRHAALLSMLGLTQVAVLVNKLDLVGRDAAVFARLERELRALLDEVGLRPRAVIPVSGRDGDNLASRGAAMPWYDGPTVLDALDGFALPPRRVDAPFRLWVQDVYKFSDGGDARRIVAGTVESGAVSAGDELVFFPSGKRAQLATLEAFPGPPPARAEAGEATGFTLAQPVYVPRGELATRADQPAPKASARLRASLLWLARAPLTATSELHLRLGTSRVAARLERVHRVLADGLASVEGRDEVRRHELAECTLVLERAVAFDVDAALPDTGRFVLVQDFEVVGGGVVREALDDRQAAAREAAWRRNRQWAPGAVPAEVRARRHGQRPALLVITGPSPHDRKALARALEARLFAAGHAPYFLGIGNVLHGVDADLPRDPGHRLEHLRRLSEVAHLLLDAGQLLLVTAQELTADEVALLRTAVAPHPVTAAWLGEARTTDLAPDVVLPSEAPLDALALTLWQRLADDGAVTSRPGDAPTPGASADSGARMADRSSAPENTPPGVRADPVLPAGERGPKTEDPPPAAGVDSILRAAERRPKTEDAPPAAGVGSVLRAKERRTKSEDPPPGASVGAVARAATGAGTERGASPTVERDAELRSGPAEERAAATTKPLRTPRTGAVVWLTGLPAAGKTTLARAVVDALARRGVPVEHLDGDAIREVFPATGFSAPERDAHVRRVGFVASRLEAHGVVVVASLVSPYAASRDFVRGLCARFVEVHVATPLAECERRDPKGLYAKARAGEVTHFTGVSDPYEAPRAPELSFDTTGRAVDDAVAAVLAALAAKGALP